MRPKPSVNGAAFNQEIDMTVQVTDQTFDNDVLQADGPVLVDLWAEWCGPCRAIAPILEELENDYDGKLTIAKVDVDANPETARRFGVRSIPTLLLFNGGDPKETTVGVQPKAALASLVDRYVA
jgi:thioredoxin 1